MAAPPEAPGTKTTRADAVREMERARFASIAAAIGCISAVGVGLSLSVPLLSLEMERMGASGTLIGINTALAGFAAIVTVPFVPKLAVRVGVLPLLWTAVAVAALSLIAFKATYDIVWWFPLRFVYSAALGALFALSEYWINSAAPPKRRGFVMGIYATILALGFAAGPAVLAVVGTSGWPPYIAGACLCAAAALPLLLARGVSPRIDGGSGRTVRSFILAAPAATVAALIFGAVESGAFAILPLYGLAIGYVASGAVFLVSVMALGNVVLQIPLGMISDRMDRRVLLAIIATIGLAGALAMPLVTDSLYGFGALLLLWGGVAGGLYTVGLAHLGARFSGGDLAAANAAFVILYNAGMMIGPPLAGGGLDLLPPHGFAFAMALLFAGYLAVVATRLRR
ncbi:MAG: MFS transporter [Salinarimonadaceae bacterium]|nr:MAG: MFS transporter [Salinarimonadaceae bacterium]